MQKLNWLLKSHIYNMDNLIIMILSVSFIGKEVVNERRNGQKGVKLSSCQKLLSTLQVVEQFNL